MNRPYMISQKVYTELSNPIKMNWTHRHQEGQKWLFLYVAMRCADTIT